MIRSYNARMAEWSKAVDLRPTIIRCEGFEPLFVHSDCIFITNVYIVCSPILCSCSVVVITQDFES